MQGQHSRRGYEAGNSLLADIFERDGDLCWGDRVQALGATVRGKVDGGTIRVAGNATVEGSVTGDFTGERLSAGLIEAEGWVKVGSLEHARIIARGDAQVQGCSANSDLFARRAAIGMDFKGGRLCCRDGAVVTGDLGFRFGQETSVILGYDPWLLFKAEAVEFAIQGVKERLCDARLQKMRGSATAERHEEELLQKLAGLERRKLELWTRIEETQTWESAKLVVRGEVRPGVEVAVGPALLRIEEPLSNVTFVHRDLEIAVERA